MSKSKTLELQRLKNLLDNGVITKAEYNRLRNEITGSVGCFTSAFRLFGLLLLLVIVGFMFFAPKNNSSPTEDNDQTNTQELTKEEIDQTINNIAKDPNKIRLTECLGVRVWESPPKGWKPPTEKECFKLADKMGIPKEEQIFIDFNGNEVKRIKEEPQLINEHEEDSTTEKKENIKENLF